VILFLVFAPEFRYLPYTMNAIESIKLQAPQDHQRRTVRRRRRADDAPLPLRAQHSAAVDPATAGNTTAPQELFRV
jgi:hypothetical protein